MDRTVTTSASDRDDLDVRWADTLDRLRAFVAARVEDREVAADITQDVIVRSIASGALERVDNPAAWLYRAARNAVIDHYRTRHRHDSLDRRRPLARPRHTRRRAERRHPRAVALPPTTPPPTHPGRPRRARASRRRRPDPPSRRRHAGHLGVGDEVPGPARPPRAQGPARAVLHRRVRHHRCGRRLPLQQRQLQLRDSTVVMRRGSS